MELRRDPTADDIDIIIARGKRNARISTLLGPCVGWLITGLAALVGFISSMPFLLMLSFGVAVFSLYSTFRVASLLPGIEEREALFAWKIIQAQQQNKYLPLNHATHKLGYEVRKVYEFDPRGTILPLRQAARLIDTHRRQQERLRRVVARMTALKASIESLREKWSKLRELGEEHPQSAQKLQRLTEDFEALLRDQTQIQSSCTRLDMIVISAQEVAKSHQLRQKLRQDLDDLSEPLDIPATSKTELAFAPESLEEIERQIGREIETYLRLERETEEHLH